MPTAQHTYNLLRFYTLKSKSATVEFTKFVPFVQRYAKKHEDDEPELKAYDGNTGAVVTRDLEELRDKERLELHYEESRIVEIAFPRYFLDLVRNFYRKIEDQPEIPFPDEPTLGVNMPAGLVHSVSVKLDFAQVIKQQGAGKPQLLKFLFPDDVRELVATSDMLRESLLHLSVDKIRLYLSDRNNHHFVLQQLSKVFRQRELAVKEMLEGVLTRGSQTMETITNPTEFSYPFWAHLANIIIQEYRPKEKKQPKEHSFSQAAYLIGYYSVYYKGIHQKKMGTQSALKKLEANLRKPPYAYTLSDMLAYRDAKGIPITRMCDREDIVNFLKRSTQSDSPEVLPELVRLTPNKERECYVFKGNIPRLCFRQVYSTSREMRQYYLNTWIRELNAYNETEPMRSDAAFAQDVEARLRGTDPLLAALLNFRLLYLAHQELPLKKEAAAELDRIIDQKGAKLVPVPDILGLDRREILHDAQLKMPLWKTFPGLKQIAAFFKRLFTRNDDRVTKVLGTVNEQPERRRGASAAARSGNAEQSARQNGRSQRDRRSGGKGGRRQATAKQQREMLKQHVERLTAEFIGEGGDLEATLEELAEKWNPLFDPDAKANLVSDVNALVRDYVRNVNRGLKLRAPDKARIKNLAEGLSANAAFNEIRRRDLLRQYIELYMVKLLDDQIR